MTAQRCIVLCSRTSRPVIQRREPRRAATATHIKRVVDEWPALTAEQRDRLALLLRGGER